MRSEGGQESINSAVIFYLPHSPARDEPEMQNKINQPGDMKLQDSAICMAVFCLSPVSIQKFIPALLSVSIVSGTPS